MTRFVVDCGTDEAEALARTGRLICADSCRRLRIPSPTGIHLAALIAPWPTPHVAAL